MSKPRWLTLGSTLIAILVVACGVLAYEQYETRKAISQIEWETAIHQHNEGENTMSLDVGVIQFLHNGFSVTLDTVETNPTGVVLVGKFGNPKAVALSSLTLEFLVEHRMYEFRDAYEKSPFGFLFSDTLTVGKAQTLVGDVPVGGTAPFRAVIPGVKGNLKGYDVTVKLSGERYQYLR